MTPAACRDSGAFVYHEPDARASRICAIGESAVAAGLDGCAFARVAAPLATPHPLARPLGSPSAKVPFETRCVSSVHFPAGVCPRIRHENARSARHENVQASRRFTKRQGRFLDRSGTIRAKSISRMILLAQFSCEPPCQSQFAHSRSRALIQFWLIFLSRGDCPISRDNNNISQSRMRREERQRRDCDWQGRLKKNDARRGNERASGNERFSASGE